MSTLRAKWKDAYAAFVGAFDTPQMRRQMNDDYSKDARDRLRDFDAAFNADQSKDKKDAALYRLLRDCSPFSSGHAGITIKCPVYDNGRLIQEDRFLWGTELDKYLTELLKSRS